jgi:raffinose/stachyose/melibiose transport system permease protein
MNTSIPYQHPRSLRWAEISAAILKYVILVFFSLLVLIPLVVTVMGGFKTNPELFLTPFTPPSVWIADNYRKILQLGTFWRMLLNSTLVMFGTAVGVVVLASMAAFVFARMKFRGRDLLFAFVNLGLLFPIAVAILPLYITLRQSGLVDSLWGVILPQIAFALPLNTLILRNFFKQIPQELEEAAVMDGCGSFTFFWRILLPLARPALAAVVVLTMVLSWNNFFLPLLVLNTEALYTIPLGIMQFQGQYGSDWAGIMAFISLSLIPTIGFYLAAERQIIAGLTAGAVKG